jgi:hypothetical protein
MVVAIRKNTRHSPLLAKLVWFHNDWRLPYHFLTADAAKDPFLELYRTV